MAGKMVDTSREAASIKGDAYLAVWDNLPRCINCKRPMRPYRGAIRDWPATMATAAVGACSSCYNAGFRVNGARRFQSNTGTRAARKPVPRLTTRQEAASHWSPEERSFAVLCAEYLQDPDDLVHVLDMFGLFDDPEIVGPTIGLDALDTRFQH